MSDWAGKGGVGVMDKGGISITNEGGGTDRGGVMDEGGVGVMNEGGGTDRGRGRDMRCVMDEHTAVGGVTDESVHTPFTGCSCIHSYFL